MSTTLDDLTAIEEGAAAHLAEDSGLLGRELEASPVPDGAPPAAAGSARLVVAAALSTVGAAIMAGGIFLGAAPRVVASLAGLAGAGIAVGASRLKKASASNALIAAGLFAIGLIAVVPTGIGNVGDLRALVSTATHARSVLRPPVPFTPGWHAIVAWLLGLVGFVASWTAIVVRRPALAVLLPLPVAAIAGISTPKNAQVASGIVVLVLFAASLGVLSSASAVAEGEQRPSLAFELRRAGRGVVFIALITGVLVGLAQTHFLFPKPVYNPAQQPQKPRTVPLHSVPDRVLFEVDSNVTGPWRMGSLDVYDGKDWRLPAFTANRLRNVARSGIVNPNLPAGSQATFTIEGLSGAVLPTLPNTVGVIANGPQLAYDSRNANIRVAQGQVTSGLSYTVAAAPLPKVTDLTADTEPLPAGMAAFTQVPPAPPAVADLIAQARAQFHDPWEQFDFLRNYVLSNVTAVGQGVPESVPPEKVQDMLAGSKQGSPFDIVAAQALLARWDGVPSRIGYGYDGGDAVGGKLQVHPKHGISFVEVYFPRFEWLPVIGTPKKAQPTVGSDPGDQQVNPNILPSNDIAVQMFVPVMVKPKSVFGVQLLQGVLLALALALFGLLVYTVVPGIRKLRVRARRRRAAQESGPRARLLTAYAEWRDLATDYGYRHTSDTPLMFLERFGADEEHTELAWLVTRAAWGDLRGQVTPEMALAAEELSRSLRRRMSGAHPGTLRVVATVSRLSLHDPYAPSLDRPAPPVRRKEVAHESVLAT